MTKCLWADVAGGRALAAKPNERFVSKTDLLTLKEFVETGKVRPHPYHMPVNLWSPPKEAAA